MVEVRSAGVNKGTAAMHFVSRGDYDFILAVGDDWTDEDLFKILPEKACRLCGRPEIYQDDLCEQCWNDQNRVPEQPKKGIIDRLKEQEEEELRRPYLYTGL